jgi:hypothetical protein
MSNQDFMAQKFAVQFLKMPNKLLRRHFHVYLRIIFRVLVILTHQVRSLSQSLNNKLMALCSSIDILDVIRCGLKVAGCVVALGDEDIVIHTTFKWFIQGDWWALMASADVEV